MEYFTYSTIYSSYFFLLIANIFGILKYKSLKNDEKWYVYYLIYTSVIEATVNLSVEVFGAKDTSAIYPFYIGGVFSILTYLYVRKLNLSRLWSLVLPAIGVLYLFLHRFFEGLNHDHIKVISNIIIFSFAGFTLLQEIRKNKSDNRFLLVDAIIFLYYTVSAFIFILHHQLGNMDIDSAYLIWGINNILTCILYLSFIYIFSKLKN